MMDRGLPKFYKVTLMFGSAIWGVSAIIGVALSLALERTLAVILVTANDVAVAILLLPWFIGSLFAEGTRSSAMAAAKDRAWLGGSTEAMQRDAAELRSDKGWIGSFAYRSAFAAGVVLVLDLIVRMVLGVGWTPFPVLGQ